MIAPATLQRSGAVVGGLGSYVAAPDIRDAVGDGGFLPVMGGAVVVSIAASTMEFGHMIRTAVPREVWQVGSDEMVSRGWGHRLGLPMGVRSAGIVIGAAAAAGVVGLGLGASRGDGSPA